MCECVCVHFVRERETERLCVRVYVSVCVSVCVCFSKSEKKAKLRAKKSPNCLNPSKQDEHRQVICLNGGQMHRKMMGKQKEEKDEEKVRVHSNNT